jgi:hypothetical protein
MMQDAQLSQWLKNESQRNKRPRHNKIIHAPFNQNFTIDLPKQHPPTPKPIARHENSPEKTLPRSETRQYLKNMLVTKMIDKFADSEEARHIVEGEVLYFLNSSNVTKKSIHALEAKL